MHKWYSCETCFEMVLDAKRHVCHPKILSKVDEHLDRVIREEIANFEAQIDDFWSSKDIQFYEYLLNKGRKRL